MRPQLGSLQYVMTLAGPPRRATPRLMGLFDPITNNPWWLVLGIVGGVVGAHFYGKRRR